MGTRRDGLVLQFKKGSIVDRSESATCQGAGLCGRGCLCMIETMKQYLAVLAVFVLAALAVSAQGVDARDRVMADSAAPGETKSQLSLRTLKNDVPSLPPIAVPSESASSSDVSDIPSISGCYSIGGRTVLPCVGAGFYGGYSSEFTRSVGGEPPTQSDLGLRSQFEQSVSSNEFQLGVRITI